MSFSKKPLKKLAEEQKAYLRGKRYENEKLKQGTNNQFVQSEKGQNVPQPTTSEKLAEK